MALDKLHQLISVSKFGPKGYSTETITIYLLVVGLSICGIMINRRVWSLPFSIVVLFWYPPILYHCLDFTSNSPIWNSEILAHIILYMHFYRISNNQITASKHCYSLQASYVVGRNVCDKILDKCSFQRIEGYFSDWR